MRRFPLLALLVLPCFALAACEAEPAKTTSSSSSSSSSSSGQAGAGGAGGADGSNPVTLDDFVTTAASAVCDALFRCCDAANVTDYFTPYAMDDNLVAFKSQIPPQKTFADAAECSAVLAEMMAIVPFGDWVTAAKAEQVQYDPAVAGACRDALSKAACGTEMERALFDDTCFSFYAPSAPRKRSMFTRNGSIGAACVPIKDGVGSRYYGTCDPNESFCCYAKPEDPTSICAYPFDADGNARKGTCKAVSASGGDCSLGLTTVQLCKTGDDCDGATNKCVTANTTPLAVGDVCFENFLSTGECKDSYCDVLGTGKCEALKTDGSPCQYDYECQIGNCEAGTCGISTYCDGM